ncbi:MAG: hypothetical protein ACRDRZ_17315 [Pseudonocardiaceae bacterium]
MAEGNGIDVRPDSMDGLASALYLGMISLDGLAFTAPTLPNGGESTPKIAEAIASVSEALGAFTASFGAAGENVEATNQTNRDTEDAVTRSFQVDAI